MAVILNGFLTAAQITNLDEDGNVLDADGEEVTVDTPFDDLGTVPFASYNSINKLYELGIAAGTGDGSNFDPSALVSRGQMAVFVTRALAHTNARPAGISMQTETMGTTGAADHDVTVSVRDENHQPVPDALVDIFTSDSPDEAWDDEGGCVAKHVVGRGPCAVDDDDDATDPDGNTEGATVMLTAEPGTTTVWAWTGEPGDEFDIDEDAYVTTEIDAEKPASQVTVTDDMKENANVLKFGDTVTFTLQVANADDDPVAEADLEIAIEATTEDTSDGDSADDGLLRPDSRTTKSTVKTDAAGRVVLSYSADDPDADEDNQDEITLTVTLPDNLAPSITADDADSSADGIQLIVMWVDDDSVAETLALSQSVNYHETNDDGVRNTVQATLVDQYGDPVKSRKVEFWSSAMDSDSDDDTVEGLGGEDDSPAALRTTSRSGVATKSYSRNLTGSFAETLNAKYVLVGGDCDNRDMDCDGADAADTDIVATAITHNWAERVEANDTPATPEVSSASVLVADTDNNTIIVDSTGPKLLTYKSGDQFRISGSAVTMEKFEKALSIADPDASTARLADTLTANIGDDDDDINTFNIAANN